MTARPRHLRAALLVLLGSVVLASCTAEPVQEAPQAPPGSVAQVCDRLPPGPAEAPAGAVKIDPAVPGDLSAKTRSSPAGTTFWLAPGRHVLGDDRYDQISPKPGNVYLGGPGAVLDGRKVNQYAFSGSAPDVRIQHLVVQGFAAPHDEGVVNHDSADGWVIEHSAVQDNDGAALMAGARQQVRGNCLRRNGQYGMNAYSAAGPITGLVVEGNEITGNNTGDWETRIEGCGCTGGIKFWSVDGADVRGNWVHANRGVGLWADTNNNDFLVEGNVIEDNDGSALVYETSYNAVIRDNAIRRNNRAAGQDYFDRGDNFPVASVYVSESGGEPRVPARTDKLEITGNAFEHNWNGITLWENADRFCNSPANTSSGTCTRLVPEPQACAQPGIAAGPLNADCRWKTQRVEVHRNRFVLDPAVAGCEESCARMALLANFGTYPDWSPYRGEVVQQAITFGQQNRFHDNTYAGPWHFVAFEPSRVLGFGEWQGAPYKQDAGSRLTRAGGG